MNNDVVRRELTKPGGLIEDLTALRQAAGYTGKQLADRLNWDAPTLSRLETGTRLPTEEKVRMYLLACGASKPEQKRILGKLAEILRAYPEWERQRRAAERHAVHEKAAGIPPVGPLRDAYHQGYAAALEEMQSHLWGLRAPSTNEA